MSDKKGAQVTPIRGTPIRGSGANPERPGVQPKPNAVNMPLVALFGVMIVGAGGVFAYSQFATPAAPPSMVERERGDRITGGSTRMRTGVNIGDGRMTASLADDTPSAPAAVPSSIDDAALRGRIADLEAALLEASKESPEIGKLVEEAASNAKRIAELEVELSTAENALSDADADFQRRLNATTDDLKRAHEAALDQLIEDHQFEMADAEGRLMDAQDEAAARIAALMDERAEASRNARIRSPSVIVNRRLQQKTDQPFGTPVIPSDPGASLAQGASFNARLLGDVNVALPGSVTALVGSDIRSANAATVLIPRGSLLRGRYRTEERGGDMRVVVAWNGLTAPDGSPKRLTAGPDNKSALVTTLWPNDPASLNREAQITVLATSEITLK